MILYKDKNIQITDREITIGNYYFPTGRPKIINWNRVRFVFVRPLTLWNGKYRVWGMGLTPYWFHSDWRAEKNQMIVIDTGRFIKAAVTPDDFEAATVAIKTKIRIEEL